MGPTVILAVFFPLVTIFNSYCLGKVLGAYFKKYRASEAQSIAAGFAVYAVVVLAAVFLFVFVPIEYRILIYLLVGVQGVLLVLYAFSWRSVFAFYWPGWRASFGFLGLVALFYGLSLLLGSRPYEAEALPRVVSQSVQTSDAAGLFRFGTWQKFINGWVLLTGGDYAIFLAYSAPFVLATFSAAAAYRFIVRGTGIKRRAAALLLLSAAYGFGA